MLNSIITGIAPVAGQFIAWEREQDRYDRDREAAQALAKAQLQSDGQTTQTLIVVGLIVLGVYMLTRKK